MADQFVTKINEIVRIDAERSMLDNPDRYAEMRAQSLTTEEIQEIRERYRYADRDYTGPCAHDIYALLDYVAKVEAENSLLIAELLRSKTLSEARLAVVEQILAKTEGISGATLEVIEDLAYWKKIVGRIDEQRLLLLDAVKAVRAAIDAGIQVQGLGAEVMMSSAIQQIERGEKR